MLVTDNARAFDRKDDVLLRKSSVDCCEGRPVRGLRGQGELLPLRERDGNES